MFCAKSIRVKWWMSRLIGSYIRSWERPGDLPRVIEILCLFASGAQRNEREDTTISITSGRSPGLSQQRNIYLCLLFSFFRISRCPFPYL
jgi:hypothetical protein